MGEQHADDILTALDKAGYAIVPKEPTEEMLQALSYPPRIGRSTTWPEGSITNKAYYAMLAAAAQEK
jgi:hypothetical protein